MLDESALAAPYQGPYRVTTGQTWVLGDNRDNAYDSRMWFGGVGGGVPRDNVKGRARLVWFSPGGLHQGVDLAGDPVAPSPELAPALAACLASRPRSRRPRPPAAH